jgi:hypothetical protein
MNLFDMGIRFEDLLCDLAVTPSVCDWRVFYWTVSTKENPR